MGLYKNKNWLYNQYVTNQRSACEISKFCKVTHSTITSWLKKYNIPIRGPKERGKNVSKKVDYKKRQEKIKNTCLERYGTDNPNKNKEIQNKSKQTNLKKYGVENPFQSEDIKNKIKNIMKEKYGVDNISQSDEIKLKKQKTCQQNYGTTNPSQSKVVRERVKNTCMEKYNAPSSFESDSIKEKIKQTCINRYGVEYAVASKDVREKIKRIFLEKYGFENPFQSDEIREQIKRTFLEKYGFENPFQSNEIKEKITQTNIKKYGVKSLMCLKEFRKKFKEKTKKTNIKRYGFENPSNDPEIQQKIYNTKKQNNTLNTSKIEDYAYDLLKEIFPNTKRWHKDNKYPYVCDLYISELDLFIEIQGNWTHGSEPFDSTNKSHRKIIKKWLKKAQETNFKGKKKKYYNNAIDVWVNKDTKKRKIAKTNNLRYLEIFCETPSECLEKLQNKLKLYI